MHRRDFLKILGATALSANRIEAALASAPPGAFLPVMALEERDEVSHIINRLTFGPTPDLVAHVREIGVEVVGRRGLGQGERGDAAHCAGLPLSGDRV